MIAAFYWRFFMLWIQITVISDTANRSSNTKQNFSSEILLVFICDTAKARRAGARRPQRCWRVAIVILHNISEASILVAELPLIAISPNGKRKLLGEWTSADRNGADSVSITVSLIQSGWSFESREHHSACRVPATPQSLYQFIKFP